MRQAPHALAPLKDFDVVIVDSLTPGEHIERMRASGIHVVVAGLGGTTEPRGKRKRP